MIGGFNPPTSFSYYLVLVTGSLLSLHILTFFDAMLFLLISLHKCTGFRPVGFSAFLLSGNRDRRAID